MHKTLIVIPARYGSTRLPGKPLIKIAGREMLLRVADMARYVSTSQQGCDYVVATDDERIMQLCQQHNVPCMMTSEQCSSGTERCFDVLKQLTEKPDFIVNLQGDNPFCPPWFISELIQSWRNSEVGEVFTPYVELTWQELDDLRAVKQITPFSGTTVQTNHEQLALTFSKNIIPAIRKEASMRQATTLSPVKRHIGLYGYTASALEAYFTLPESVYESCEGLEQMRFLENSLAVKMVPVSYQGHTGMSGVDSPEDIKRAEAIIARDGEYDLTL
ncbi:3-deoxy-manno-octulosonate cytidylyltransferase [Pseudoalteromonas holothuriae]|uniref:3-deoxy-manno-octulosonate cytidylyltransferase n=1 Tax=Pseudoalteromonas holothuriae TaxID=2963714 RepID=A0A9W4VSR6_9GAMM|nr:MULTISPECIES: manno-octulosonate cytidylyltransferase [unclassified Pseudoalteromonas]CAH9060402.1 3-deoxy-manno-octulosonate cytidylyltransferase [Pseudoalteromonas sp. CIP111854]CAH9065960.1 3-deoxy-manno-octulosonate cytidylyltransferase [Pseudoalteromonas sp. CIP111951]